MAVSVSEMEAATEKTARVLSLRYEVQCLCCLSLRMLQSQLAELVESSAQHLADTAVARVLEQLVAAGFDDDQNIADQMIDLVSSPRVCCCFATALMFCPQPASLTHKFKDLFENLIKADRLSLKPRKVCLIA